MGLMLLARPQGDSDATNMSHVPHPPSGRFLRPWFPLPGACVIVVSSVPGKYTGWEGILIRDDRRDLPPKCNGMASAWREELPA